MDDLAARQQQQNDRTHQRHKALVVLTSTPRLIESLLYETLCTGTLLSLVIAVAG